MLEFIQPPLSYVVFGAMGGLLYILRQHMKGYPVKPMEYLARPIFGATAAYVLTVALHLPNHLTSLVTGYFGIDVWDTVAERYMPKLALGKHGPKPPGSP
jgi:hypothetical protein